MDVDWKSIPWRPITAEAGQGVLAELQSETAPIHPLFGLTLVPLALGHDGDDVLFQLNDGRVAAVHLTWSGKVEPYPDCPSAAIYPCLAAFFEEERKAAQEWG